MKKIFISHSSKDDDFVRRLQQALADLGHDGWIDSRELRGGDQLWSTIQTAIDGASAYAVVVSTDGLQSKWVGEELRCALDVQKQRGKDNYPVIPLSLNGTKLGVLEMFFGEEPLYIAVTSEAGGVEAAMNAILVAMGVRLPTDVAPTPQPKAEPLEELVLELTDLKIREQDGKRRATARARLVYEPAKPGQPPVHSTQSWRFNADLGPIEAGELSWYLEKYAIWPSEYFRPRASKVEADLVKWGKLLHQAAMPAAHTANVMQAWAKIDNHAGRRFSVHVDVALEAGAPDAEIESAREAATLLLGLPWEMLHDGEAYLFQGAAPTRVRRRLPNTRALDVAVVATPIRILLVTARPENEACGYIDHRASALPLVEATEALGGLVTLHVLSPPTLPALRDELDRARRERAPYHVVHFDGHGVYDRHAGLGGLCFEDPHDIQKLDKRGHVTIYTNELGPLLRDHRIPLVFLEACQTAQAEQASESVASELLKVGVASVVAMSHSVLVETARRFVEVFYEALARGARVGDAMLAGQRKLKDDTSRGQVFGAGELKLEDWFVPVLFQEKDDPQLFRRVPVPQTKADLQAALGKRLGELPAVPETGFIGRSRELLALQRLLREGKARYAVVRGQGGEGKTALAAEFARWMVRSQQMRRAAFVSVETHSNINAVLDAIGRQLVPGYSVATFDSLEKATLPVERELTEQSTLLVVDNVESILLPPYLETPEVLSEDARRELDDILKLCARLNAIGDTRIIFTSREALPAPFDAQGQRRELHQLDRDDAVKLVERALNREAAGARTVTDEAPDVIVALVEAVNGHACTLALLAPALRSHGVEATHASLVALMVEMERKFPGNPEKSLYASVELSLRRMSTANRERARVLGVFHGGVNVVMLHMMMGWAQEDVSSLAGELIGTGLATDRGFNHLTLNPALCPYLYGQMEIAERERLTVPWNAAMRRYCEHLVQDQSRHPQRVAALTQLELPNLFALLDHMRRSDDAEATVVVAASLHKLLLYAGRPRLLARVTQECDAGAARLGTAWSQARFQAERIHIEQAVKNGQFEPARESAMLWLGRSRAAGEQAYPGADFDLAIAVDQLAAVLLAEGSAESALPLLVEAEKRFDVLALIGNPSAERMAMVSHSRRGDCFLSLRQSDQAIAVYEASVARAAKLDDYRQIAMLKGNIGNASLLQRDYKQALRAFREVRECVPMEPGIVAQSWQQTGTVYRLAGDANAAENAYRESLQRWTQIFDVAGEAKTLFDLALLYGENPDRLDDAARFCRLAAEKFGSDRLSEGLARSYRGRLLVELGDLSEARNEIRRAIECKEPFGFESRMWETWAVLERIEADVGNSAAAAEAKRKAIACFLGYRRGGGENHDLVGEMCLDVIQRLFSRGPADAISELQRLGNLPNCHSNRRPLLQALQAIVAGSRDHTLADAPELDYSMAAEILWLIETLEKRT